MGRGPRISQSVYLCIAIIVGQLGFAPPKACASGTNVFIASDTLQGAVSTATGVKVRATHTGVTDALLGTNAASTVLAIAVSGMDCGTNGLNPQIALVAYNKTKRIIVAPLIGFTNAKTIYSGPGQLTIEATGEGLPGVVSANFEALITLSYKDCTATAPAKPQSVTIEPTGLVRPTGTISGPTPSLPDEALLEISTTASNLPVFDVLLYGDNVAPPPQPQLVVGTNVLNFGSVAVGSNQTLSVSLHNAGGSSLHVTNLLSGSAAFSLVTPAPVTLVPGATTTVSVQFTPYLSGPDAATLILTSNDPSNAVQYVYLTSNGSTAPTAAQLSVAPLDLNFGSVPLGTNLVKNLTIANAGGLTGTVTRFNFLTNAVGFSVIPAAPFSVPPGTSQVVQVTFTPISTNSVSGTLQIDSANPTNLMQVTIEAAGVNPTASLAITPTTLDFGTVAVGTNRLLTVTLANNSLTNLNVTDIITNTDAFALVNPPTLPLALAPGMSTNIVIAFTPGTNGVTNSTWQIANDNPAATNNLTLTGVGAEPVAGASALATPGALSFGTVALGTSDELEITLSNIGTTNSTIYSVTVVGDTEFTVVTPATPFDLPVNQMALIGVKFAPTNAAPIAAALQIVSSDPSNTVQLIPLTGTGVQAQLLVNTNTLNFGSIPVGTRRTLSITLSNTNVVNNTIRSLSFPSGTEFALDPSVPTSAFVIGTNQSVTIPIVFTASAAGAATGVLEITSDDPTPQFVSLTGVGLASSLSYSSSFLNFGNVATGGSSTLGLTLTNSGNTNAFITALNIIGDGNFQAGPLTLPFNLAGGSNVTINVNYRPQNLLTILILSGTVRSQGTAVALP